MHKIGIVGPKSSVERILSVAQEIQHEITFIAFIYNDPQEVVDIMKHGLQQVNGWLFTGPLPYMIAKNNMELDENFYYCQAVGTGFYICCMQMMLKRKSTHILERISIDMIDVYHLDEWLAELNLPSRELYIKKYNHEFALKEMIGFHYKLWQEGKTDGAITTVNSIYQALVSLGVPVYHSTLTRMEISQALMIIIEKVKKIYFKGTQVGLIIFKIDNYDEMIEKAQTPYVLQDIELKIKQMLLPLCQHLNGYIVDKGNGKYEIFSSRGIIEQGIATIQETIRCLLLEMEVVAIVGIGFGETVFSAEINAHRAVSNAKKKQHREIVIVRDDGVIIESAGQETEVAYGYNSENKELIEKLQHANVNIKTYGKMEAIIRRLGWHTFTSGQLAEQMAVTDRNIRRIIANLCEVGLVEYAGEDASAIRGRPGKLYRLIDK